MEIRAIKISFTLLFACSQVTLVNGQEFTELQERIKNSTIKEKQNYHVVFQESDYLQANAGYNADVILYINGEEELKVKGSTLPNHQPGNTVPDDWEYSVVMPTCKFSFYGSSDNKYYSWKRGKRADGTRECLRLNYKLPTVNISSARTDVKEYVSKKSPEMDELSLWIFDLFGQNADLPQYQYATNILIHAGWSGVWRGSAGCLTIDPSEAESFFNAIPDGLTGSLEIIRTVSGECR